MPQIVEWCINALSLLSQIASALLLIWIPLALFRSTRAFAGSAIFTSTYIWGAGLWFMSTVAVLNLWGWIALLVGLLLFGVGVVPIALVALVLNGQWSQAGYLMWLLIQVLGLRLFAVWLITKSERTLTVAA